jgi:UDP-N-acetylmuramoyl-L-alanyl-D-glutamate--2,6-diaminopimelate ligase
LEISLPGIFNAYNALGSFATACTLGFDPYAVADALKGFSGVKGRCENVPTYSDFSVVIDYAHTPDGLFNVLVALRPFVEGRIICVFGCGGDRDKSKRPLMGQIASANSDYVIVTSDNPRTESRIGIVNDILSGIPSGSPVEVIPDRRAAIIKGILEAKRGDLVLIAGKGHETYQIIGTQKIEFDERKIISEALEYKEQL